MSAARVSIGIAITILVVVAIGVRSALTINPTLAIEPHEMSVGSAKVDLVNPAQAVNPFVPVVRTPAGAAPPATGRLVLSDGITPCGRCVYGLISSPTEGAFTRDPIGETGEDGSWTLAANGKQDVWLAFYVDVHLGIAFQLSCQAVQAGDITLVLPQLGYQDIRIEGLGEDEAMHWDCSVEPANPTHPGTLDTVSNRVWQSQSPHRVRVVRLVARKYEGLTSASVINHLAPVGAELVTGAFSPTHQLLPTRALSVVPSPLALRASRNTDGVWIHYRSKVAGNEPNLQMVYGLRREPRPGRPLDWRGMPMYNGQLFVPTAAIARYARVEMVGLDGESFEARLEGLTNPSIDWRQGNGRAPIGVGLPDGCEVTSVWYLDERMEVAQCSPFGPDAGSARQFRIANGQLLVSLPSHLPQHLIACCGNGTVFEYREGVLEIRAVLATDPRYCVVPPGALLGLKPMECLVVRLQALVSVGGQSAWIEVGSRRLDARDDASAWSIQIPAGLKFLARWERVVQESDGSWRNIGQGQHDVGGSDAVLAQPKNSPR